MLRQDELAFMKAISTLQFSPALLKELRLAMARRKKPTLPVWRRSTTIGSGTRASQLAGKRKSNEIASAGDSNERVNRCTAPGGRSALRPANSKLTSENAADGSRQPNPSGKGVTYAVVLTGPVSLSWSSGPLKPTAIDSDPSEPGVSMEKTIRRMPSDMSGSLSGMPNGTTSNVQVAND